MPDGRGCFLSDKEIFRACGNPDGLQGKPTRHGEKKPPQTAFNGCECRFQGTTAGKPGLYGTVKYTRGGRLKGCAFSRKPKPTGQASGFRFARMPRRNEAPPLMSRVKRCVCRVSAAFPFHPVSSEKPAASVIQPLTPQFFPLGFSSPGADFLRTVRQDGFIYLTKIRLYNCMI